MDDTVPRLIGLLLAGAVALMSLRSTLPDTASGQRWFRVILAAFVLVIAFAAYALLRSGGGGQVQPDPAAPTTVADLRRPVASIGAGAA